VYRNISIFGDMRGALFVGETNDTSLAFSACTRNREFQQLRKGKTRRIQELTDRFGIPALRLASRFDGMISSSYLPQME